MFAGRDGLGFLGGVLGLEPIMLEFGGHYVRVFSEHC